MSIVVLHNLRDPDDPQGRSYREVNLEKTHRFRLNSLVELSNGVRVFLSRYARDCDGTPLYDVMLKPCDCVKELAFMQTDRWKQLVARSPERYGHYAEERDDAGHLSSCDHALHRRFGSLVNHGEDDMTLIREPSVPSIAETTNG